MEYETIDWEKGKRVGATVQTRKNRLRSGWTVLCEDTDDKMETIRLEQD